MSTTTEHMASLIYVIQDLLRQPQKVRIKCTFQKSGGWPDYKDHEFIYDQLSVIVALGINPNALQVTEPTIYVGGTGWGKFTVTPIRLKNIINIRQLKCHGGKVLWSATGPSGTAASATAKQKSLTELLTL